MTKKVDYPSKEEVEKMIELAEIDFANGNYNHGIGPNATPSERFKFHICQMILRFKRRNKLNNLELAAILDIDPARVSEILYAKIHLYSLDRLMELAYKLSKKDKDIKDRLDKALSSFAG